MDIAPRRVLVLYWHLDRRGIRAAIQHHLRALEYGRVRHRVFYLNVASGAPEWLRHLDFDAVVLHTTVLCLRWNHLFPMWKWRIRWVRDLPCVKIALPQDEYDHSEVLDEWLAELGVSVIFSVFDESKRKLLYPIMAERAIFHRGLTGYVDDATARRVAGRLPPLEARPLDIVYRAMHLPYWFGSHGQLKHRIGEVVEDAAQGRGLSCDISTRTEDAILGDAWFEFLMSGRTVIGCESGSSVLDRRGEVRARIQRILRDEPLLGFEELTGRLPPGWDEHEFFAVSPRHFEAVITRTCQILVAGHYDGIFEPDRHYIPLRRDFSNLDEVLEKIRDVALVRTIAEQAYQDIYLSGRYSYARLAADLEAVLCANPPARRGLGRRLRAGLCRGVAPPVIAAQTAAGLFGWRVLKKGSPLWGLLGARRSALAQALVAIRFVVASGPLRRLLRAYLRDAEAGRTIGLDRLLADLLRLGIVYQAQTGRLTAGWPFRVAAAFDARTGQLTLRSYPLADGAGADGRSGEADRGLLEQSLRAGRVRGMVWDHSAMASYVPYAVTRGYWLSIALGESGVYRFTALLGLAHRVRPEAGAALLAVLEAKPRPRSVVGRLLRRPRLYMTLGLRVMGDVVRVPGLRRLLLAYLGDRETRRAARLGWLLADLLRLSLLRERFGPSGRDGFQVSFAYDLEHAAMTFRSAPTGREGSAGADGSAAAEIGGPVRRIVWDHSAVGAPVPCALRGAESVSISVGPGGIYEFTALAALAARYPEHIWAALIPTGAAPRAGGR